MELVPILSTIILVGTAATFLLAVFAYIMYKWRERQVLEERYAPRALPEEPHVLVTPRQQHFEPAPQYAERQQAPVSAEPVTREEPSPTPSRRESLFWEEYTGEGFVSFKPGESPAAEGSAETESPVHRGPAWM